MNFEKTPIDSITDMPPGLSDEEQIEFFETHGFSERFWEQAEPVPADEKPRARPRHAEPIESRLNETILSRLEALAKRRGVERHVLLNDLLEQALHREEELEERLSTEPPEKREPAKPHDWQSWAYSFAKENESLLNDPDVDDITLSRLAQNSSSRLLELSDAIKDASARQGFPATQMRRMIKGYERLKTLTERAIELYRERFGDPKDDEDENQPVGPVKTSYDVIAEAEKILHGGS